GSAAGRLRPGGAAAGRARQRLADALPPRAARDRALGRTPRPALPGGRRRRPHRPAHQLRGLGRAGARLRRALVRARRGARAAPAPGGGPLPALSPPAPLPGRPAGAGTIRRITVALGSAP